MIMIFLRLTQFCHSHEMFIIKNNRIIIVERVRYIISHTLS